MIILKFKLSKSKTSTHCRTFWILCRSTTIIQEYTNTLRKIKPTENFDRNRSSSQKTWLEVTSLVKFSHFTKLAGNVSMHLFQNSMDLPSIIQFLWLVIKSFTFAWPSRSCLCQSPHYFKAPPLPEIPQQWTILQSKHVAGTSVISS